MRAGGRTGDSVRAERAVGRTAGACQATGARTRWQAIAREEAELACRSRLPEVRILPDWAQAFQSLPRPVFVLDEWEGATPLKQRGRRMPVPDTLSLVVGPEGGFSPAERAWMASLPDTYVVSLGARILRTEHAAAYALAQVTALWE
jgi:16S rRNA (uracil1498-N3)-methyltransferase